MTLQKKLNSDSMSKFPLALAALTVLAASLLAACNSGTSTSTTGTTTIAAATATTTCEGSYVGGVEPPAQDVRIANRDRQLAEGGPLGGGVDGGIYLEGSFAWETNAACQVVKGSASIFGHDLPISGTVGTDKTFHISHIGGPIDGAVDANNKITGKLAEGGGREWVHGVLNGTFTPKGKI